MEELFDLGQESLEHTDISLCIFPHLQEFLAVDLRWGAPRVRLLNTSETFGGSFFQQVEQGFSKTLREPTAHLFAHLLDLPLRVEELVRDAGMTAIMDTLGHTEKETDEFPTVAVFIISGGALSMDSDQVALAFRHLLGECAEPAFLQECSERLHGLMAQERDVVKRIDQQELREALEEQSPNYFTLWERRN